MEEEAAKLDNTFLDHILFDLNLFFIFLNVFCKDQFFVVELHKVDNNHHMREMDEGDNRIDIYSKDFKREDFYL